MKKVLFIFSLLTVMAINSSAQGFSVVKSFDCQDATQGVASDGKHFYAISSTSISKYTADGKYVATWSESNPELIKHFDGGIIVDGLLYCSHSNFPQVPMASSVEVFDPGTMKHIRTISLGIEYGSCTWVVRGEDCWYACFAHYDRNGANAGGEVLKDNSWTQIVQFDDQWRRLQGWILPKELLDQLHPNSLSGGLYVNGKFFCTGHDAQKLFILEFPPYGMRMLLTGAIDIPFKGQGVALDPEGNLWGIDRKQHKVMKASSPKPLSKY